MKTVVRILAGLILVGVICAIDLKCSAMRDARRRTAQPVESGALAHVKGEMAAGERAWKQQREEQINDQLRMFRLLAKRFAEKGEHKRARSTIALIQELERQKGRLLSQPNRLAPSRP